MTKAIHGLTAVYTGDGKGKTTAALGAVFRALGHGMHCKVIQFIKGSMNSGELFLQERLSPGFEIVQVGRGFTWVKESEPLEHKKAAALGLQMARDDIPSGKYGMVVLDEIFYALKAELVTIKEIEELIDLKPSGMHLILTGRGAPPEIIERADLVTRMEPVKHPMEKGIPAQEGLDF